MPQALHRVHYTRDEYISFERSSVDVVRRGPDGGWTTESAEAGGRVTLVSLGCLLAVDDMYRGAADAISG